MCSPLSTDLASLSNRDLLDALARLLRREREATADLVALIAEVDARKLYRDEACPSMHAFCVDVLHLSDEAAYKRINAARAARRFPAILEMLADGRLHLSAVCLLAHHLTDDNHRALLNAAVHRSKRAVEQFLAERFPRPDVPESLRRLPSPAPRPDPPQPSAPSQAPSPPSRPAPAAPAVTPPLPPPPPPPPVLAPLAPERFKLQVTISRQTRDRLAEARDLLAHQVPTGDLAEVLDQALEFLVRELRKKKFAETRTPRQPRPAHAGVRSRHIPNHVRRAVAERDGRQCTFVAQNGRRCTARARLEYHHLTPFAAGGEPTVEGVTLRCKAHNSLAAEEDFGSEYVAQRVAAAREAREGRRGGSAPQPFPGTAVTPTLFDLGAS